MPYKMDVNHTTHSNPKPKKTRQRISQEYAQIAKVLYQQGYKTEARLMSQLKKQLDAQSHET